MKRTTVVILLMVYTTHLCFSQNKSLSIPPGTLSLKEMFAIIQNQSGMSVFYSDEVVNDDMHATIRVAKTPLTNLLDETLPPHQLSYQVIDGKFLVISQKGNRVRAEETVSISGMVKNNQYRPIAFVSVKLLVRDSIMRVSVTDEQGRFTIRYPFKDNTTYTIQFSSLNYGSKALSFVYPDLSELQEVLLGNNNHVLDEVNIKASKPPFTRLADRLVVQVEGSILENGLSTFELLQRTPGLWVDPYGNIKIRGNQSVVVMINDMVQRMSSEQLAEYLRMIPSENISKIEIIPNPAAEYEAEGSGGIVRIVLKKHIPDGLKVLLLGRYIQKNKDPYFNGGSLFDYKRGKFYLAGAVAYKLDKQQYIAHYLVQYPDQSTYQSSTDRYRKMDGYNGRVTLNYEISDQQNVGFQTIWTTYTSDQDFYTDNVHFRVEDTLYKRTQNTWLNRPTMLNSTLNYTWKLDTMGSSLKFIADYFATRNKESNDYLLTSLNTDETERYQNLSPNTTKIYSVQSDFSKQYTSHLNMIAGVKYVGTNRYNEVVRNNYVQDQWMRDSLLSNEYLYKEDLLMGYAALNYKINHTSFKGGIRAEQTFIDGTSLTTGQQVKQRYLNFFPSLFLLQDLGESGHSFHLNYAKRLRRPSFKDLNPYTLQIDDFVLLEGNADLKPEYIHKVEAGFTHKSGLSADIFYAYTADKIVLFTETVNNKLLAYQSINFKNSIDYGASLFIPPVNIAKWWSVQSNISWFQNKYDYLDIDLSQQVFQASMFQVYKFKKLLDASLYLSYSSPNHVANTKYADQFYSNLMLSRTLFKGKGKVSFTVDDIFNTQREKELTTYKGTIVNFYQKRPTRTFGLSLSYTITKGQKVDNKKIEQSNEEQRKRVEN